MKKLKELTVRFDLNYELIHSDKRKTAIGVLPEVHNTYKLTNKDGSLALNENLKIVSDPGRQLYQPNQNNTNNNILSPKEEAINEVKQLKELLDSGILNQEEYDKKAAELKKIILGN